jgi:hypothetical protein
MIWGGITVNDPNNLGGGGAFDFFILVFSLYCWLAINMRLEEK